MEANDMKAMREALVDIVLLTVKAGKSISSDVACGIIASKAKHALATAQRKGKWKNGRDYEYEYAYCSECGRMQWAGWDSHKQAEENIGSFANDYKFCPGCGAEMEGGEYVR